MISLEEFGQDKNYRSSSSRCVSAFGTCPQWAQAVPFFLCKYSVVACLVGLCVSICFEAVVAPFSYYSVFPVSRCCVGTLVRCPSGYGPIVRRSGVSNALFFSCTLICAICAQSRPNSLSYFVLGCVQAKHSSKAKVNKGSSPLCV